ncbi:MAG TPA: hypothetical protein VNA89_06625 [Gemmatimonadaceae bacterium]|nr:hypothetical protein [Gemmatimonadaceae bacterium]
MSERRPPDRRAEGVRRPPPRLRKRYVNERYPLVVLRFEDGHEIRIAKGEGKSFDIFPGEVVKVVAIWDPTSTERDVVASMKGEEFEGA